MLRLRREIWGFEGIIAYDIEPLRLEHVLNKHIRVGTCPEGYAYPEIWLQEKIPDELCAVLERKEQMQTEKQNRLK